MPDSGPQTNHKCSYTTTTDHHQPLLLPVLLMFALILTGKVLTIPAKYRTSRIGSLKRNKCQILGMKMSLKLGTTKEKTNLVETCENLEENQAFEMNLGSLNWILLEHLKEHEAMKFIHPCTSIFYLMLGIAASCTGQPFRCLGSMSRTAHQIEGFRWLSWPSLPRASEVEVDGCWWDWTGGILKNR